MARQAFPPIELPEKPELQARYELGTAAGLLAQQLFPGGVEVPFAGLSFTDQLVRTGELLAQGAEVVYKASFRFDGIFVKVDILVRNGGCWQIHEVKMGTAVKEVNLDDVAIQHYVLAGCGLNVSRAFLVHIDNSYVRDGAIAVDRLFAAEEVTGEVLARQDVTDAAAVRAFLDTLWHPLCHLDFETFDTPIPLFDGIRPYQKIPFQYSLHVERHPGAEPEHFEYLAPPKVDPRRQLAEKLLAEISTDACVLTYNQSFEKSVLRELAALLPDLADELLQRVENIRDLMLPFKSRAVYRWRMRGSYSLKEVLPALVPDLSYKGSASPTAGWRCSPTTRCALRRIRRGWN